MADTPEEIARLVAENILVNQGRKNSVYNNISKNKTPTLRPVFQRWVVVDVFFDPVVLNDAKKLDLINKYTKPKVSAATPQSSDIPLLTIKNLQYLINSTVPRNSILARPVVNRSESSLGRNDLMILYPLFPSYLALPVKPGEHVWVLFERLTTFDDIGYWVCGIVGKNHIEDVNHSHFPRDRDPSYNENPTADLRHQNAEENFEKYHFEDGKYFPQEPSFYKRILDEEAKTQSEAVLASVYESVPRFRKRPGDIAFEGSNNALIVLGRDRTGEAVTYTTNTLTAEDLNLDPQKPINGPQFKKIRENDPLRRKNAGSIDIVAGRGQRFGKLATGGTPVLNTRGEIEIGKSIEEISENEGNPDFKDDRSRIYVSQNTFVDKSLKIDGYNRPTFRNDVVDSPTGDAGIIIKSDKIRIFARSDVQIVVSGYDTESIPTGFQNADGTDAVNQIKNEKTKSSNWASITIKSNGDIVFTPSETGLIKLGGEDANKAILCTENGGPNSTPSAVDGQVRAGYILTQGADPLGTGEAGQGTFATKILVK